MYNSAFFFGLCTKGWKSVLLSYTTHTTNRSMTCPEFGSEFYSHHKNYENIITKSLKTSFQLNLMLVCMDANLILNYFLFRRVGNFGHLLILSHTVLFL